MAQERDKCQPSNFTKNFLIFFREYCNCSSVHGFRYFGEKRTIFERVWWIIIFIVCASACSYTIYSVYKKWDQSPVIVSFANQGTSIYNIPFPAITVCPEAKIDREKFNFTDVLRRMAKKEDLTRNESVKMDYICAICNPREPVLNTETFSEEFYDFLDFVQPNFPLTDCCFLEMDISCKDYVKPILTEEGVCYTFNMLDRSNIFRDQVTHFQNYHKFDTDTSKWSMEYGYSSEANIDSYPNRALLAGAKNGIRVLFRTRKIDRNFGCGTATQGYKVMVHDPTSLPTPRHGYFMVPLDQDVIVAIQPSLINTSDTVRMYDTERRRCYFQDERYLKFFKIYNSANCQLECLTNYTLAHCRCVNFFMPRENNTVVCGSGKVNCTREAYYLSVLRQLQNQDCNCLPLCTDLKYAAETSQGDWDWKEWYMARGKNPPEDVHLSALTLYFKSDDFIASVRNELYGPIDFLANFGGILGLFTGFSILSLMEILYFLTVRIFCNKILYGQWVGKNTE